LLDFQVLRCYILRKTKEEKKSKQKKAEHSKKDKIAKLKNKHPDWLKNYNAYFKQKYLSRDEQLQQFWQCYYANQTGNER